MKKDETKVDYGENVPYVWVGLIVTLILSIKSLFILGYSLSNGQGSMVFVSLLMLFLSAMGFSLLVIFYKENLTLKHRVRYETQYTGIATFLLVLCILWFVVFLSLSIFAFSEEIWGRTRTISLDDIRVTVIPFLFAMAIAPLFFFIKRLFNNNQKSSQTPSLESFKKRSNRLRLWNVGLFLAVLISAIYLNSSISWILFSYLLLIMTYFEWNLYERRRFFANKLKQGLEPSPNI